MRDVSGRAMGERTSYTGPSQSMREYIKSIEASPGGKALTKLGDPTEFTQVNQRWLAEMPGKTYAEKRQNWENQWGEPGSKNYRDMQQEQAIRHSEMINDPNYDPDYIPPIFDNVPPVTQPTGDPRTFTADIPGSVPRLYSGNIPGRMAAGGGYPSGFLSPAQDAAQGWAGQLGFNIDPRGGLMLRPWEAQSWQLAGIDPRLWNPGTGGVLPPGGGGGGGGGGFVPPGGGGGTVGPKYPGVPPGSDQERDRDAGRIHHPEMYNPDGSWVGAEGTEGGGGRREGPTISQGSGGQVSLPGGGGRGWVNPNTAITSPLQDKQRFMSGVEAQIAAAQQQENARIAADAVRNQQRAAAVQQRYMSSLDDEAARALRSMSEAQRAAAMEQAAIRSGQGLLAADVEGDDQGYSESGMGQQGGRGHPGMR